MATSKKLIFQKYQKLMGLHSDFPVSPHQLPGNGEAQKTTGGYGRNAPVPFASFDQNSSSLKTSQGCLPWMEEDVSVKSCPTWPRAGLMQSGQCFPLPPLVRGTGANASGLLPTPVVQDTDPRLRKAETYIQTSTGNVRRMTSVGHRALKLAEVVRMFPTPNANDFKGPNMKSPDSSSGHGLHAYVKAFPTPTASMVTANDMEQARYSGNGGKRPKYKDLYPTPIASDWKSGKSSEKTRQKNAQPLRERVNAEFLENQQSGDLPNTGSATGQPPGILNPEFVEFLMGCPIGWTELKD